MRSNVGRPFEKRKPYVDAKEEVQAAVSVIKPFENRRRAPKDKDKHRVVSVSYTQEHQPQESGSCTPKHPFKRRDERKIAMELYDSHRAYFERQSNPLLHDVQNLTIYASTPQSQKGASSRSGQSGVGSRSVLGVGGGVITTCLCLVGFISSVPVSMDCRASMITIASGLAFDERLAGVTCVATLVTPEEDIEEGQYREASTGRL